MTSENHDSNVNRSVLAWLAMFIFIVKAAFILQLYVLYVTMGDGQKFIQFLKSAAEFFFFFCGGWESFPKFSFSEKHRLAINFK